jgi:hypothetical protein
MTTETKAVMDLVYYALANAVYLKTNFGEKGMTSFDVYLNFITILDGTPLNLLEEFLTPGEGSYRFDTTETYKDFLKMVPMTEHDPLALHVLLRTVLLEGNNPLRFMQRFKRFLVAHSENT